MSYFIKESEIREKQKDINSAIALTLFFGAVGVHRFYLGRKLSGTVIFVSVILTLGQALWIVIPLVIIEFFQLALVADRMKKIASPNLSTQDSPTSIESTIINQPEAIRKSETSVAIYDVSNVETSKIPKDLTSSRAPKLPATGEWIKKLELPYERQDLKLPQLRKSIYEVYEQLAEYIDQQLRKRGSSLHKMMRQVPQGQYVYYSNVLYTIFCIAEGQVAHHYSGGRSGYDNSFSYDLLRGRTDESFRKDVERYARQLVMKLPPADDAIKNRYGLTTNGLPVTWWDQEGALREKYPLTEKHIRILNHTPSRSTKLYQTIEVRAAIFRHYFKVLSVLHKQTVHTTGWSKRMGKYLHAVFDEDKQYVDNHYRIMILNYILKLCEQAIRERIPYTRPLDITKEQTTLKRTIPNEAVQAILLAVDNPDEIHLSDETLEILRKQNPTSWKEDVADVASKSISEVITLLKSYQSDAITKVAKEVIRKSPDKKSQLIALYAASSPNDRDDWIQKKILLLIHIDQQGRFEKLVADAKPLSISLANELAELQVAPRKRIIIDKSKLALAQDDHTRAVNSVTSYLGDDLDSSESVEAPKEEQPAISKDTLFSAPSSSDVTLTGDQIDFMKMILKSKNDLDGVEATAFAKQHKKMLNGYIQSINKTLYEKFEDQIILQQDGRIMIEEEYRVAVEELI